MQLNIFLNCSLYLSSKVNTVGNTSKDAGGSN